MFIAIVGKEFTAKVLPLLAEAKKNIDIVIYDWRFYPDRIAHPTQVFNRAIIDAVRRGVIVRALVHNGEYIDTFKRLGIQAKKIKTARVLHTKMILIDREKIVIGSHNYTNNGFTRNLECSIITDIPQGETRFTDFFETLYNM